MLLFMNRTEIIEFSFSIQKAAVDPVDLLF